MTERAILPANGWVLEGHYTDDGGSPIKGDQANCTVGVYLLSSDNGELYGPACTTCQFSANLGDVFNPEDSRYVPDAPECFKKAAAHVLSKTMQPMLLTIRRANPDTADDIDRYNEMA